MRTKHSLAERGLAIGLTLLLLGNMAACTGPTLSPRAGWADFDLAMIPVPGGWVHGGGGNLFVQRSDLSMDTLLGTQEITAAYNSGSGSWTWSFLIRYDGATLRDATGFLMDFQGLAAGSVAPGTYWMKVDDDSLQTKGGLRYDFDGEGRLESVYWYTFDYPRLRYQHGSDEILIDQCTAPGVCTGVFAIELEGEAPIRVSDARTGRQAEYAYVGGLLTNARSAFETEAGLSGTRYEYDGTLLSAVTSSEGERIEYEYYVGRRIERVVQIGEGNPSHEFTHYSIDPQYGDLYRTVYTNPLGGQMRLYFDAERKLHEIQYLDTGDSRRITWIANRRVQSDRLPNGATTIYDYGLIGWDPLQIVTPAGNVVDITYDYYGLNLEDPTAPPIQRIDDSIGMVFEATYDAQGRLETRVNGAGETVATRYAYSVFPGSVTLPSGITTSFPSYGIHGHWTASEGPLADERGFDPVGNLRVASRNRRSGGFVSREFDAGRLPSALNLVATVGGLVSGFGSIDLSRRSDGQPTYIARPGGGDHRFEYDTLGRLVTRSELADGAWNDSKLEYDLAGNVVATELPNGMRQEFEYDVYHRLRTHRALRDGLIEGERIFGYAGGNLRSSFDSVRGVTEVYSYDGAGRIVSVDFGRGDVVTRQSDERDRVVSETWRVGSSVLADVGYAYDEANRVTSLQDRQAAEEMVGVAYENGRPAELRYANGLRRSLTYDPTTGRATAAQTVDANGAVVATTTLGVTSEIGPMRSQIEARVTTALGSSVEEYWLTLADEPTDPGSRVFYWTDTFDSADFSHDLLGNRADAGADVFEYNAEGSRLQAATVNGATLSYAYDEAGYVVNRAGVPVSWSAMGRMTGFGSDTALWDMSGRLVELQGAGISRRFDLFGGAIESDAGAGTVGSLDLGHVVLDLAGGERSYRHFDFRGNVSFVSDSGSAIISHYVYRPYGVHEVLGSDQGFHFVAKPALGPLMLLGARVYDAQVGRFLSPDPVLQPSNQYAYTKGNPLSFMDASGLSDTEVASFMAAFFAAVATIGHALANSSLASVAISHSLTLGILGASASGAAAIAFLAVGFTYVAVVSYDLYTSRNPRIPEPPKPPSDPRPPPPPGSPTQNKVLVIQVDLAPPPAPPPVACAPGELSRTPDASGWLPVLLLVNASLGLLVLFRRRRRSGS